MILAIDPGVGSTAAAWWADGRVVDVVTLRRLRRVAGTAYEAASPSWDDWRPVSCSPDPELAYLGAWHAILAGSPPIDEVAVEGLWGGGRTLDRLAWSAGVASGVAIVHSPRLRRILRPGWSTWHRLELGRTSRAPESTWAAYLSAIPCAPGVASWLRSEPIVDGDRHARDAVAIARWASREP